MDLMTTQALNDLRLHWDEAYKITYHPGEAEPCHAERLDDGTGLTADSPWAFACQDHRRLQRPARAPHRHRVSHDHARSPRRTASRHGKRGRET
jgi:hypothetical protein